MTLCNQTLGYAECLSGRCYLANRKCDGHFDCDDGTDEALCKYAIFLLNIIVYVILNKIFVVSIIKLFSFIIFIMYS